MKLTDQEGQRLAAIMIVMRPDWTPNKPGILLHTVNQGDGFIHAQDFGHTIRALAHYATETGPDGRPAKRTPNLYPEDGQHWTATATNPAALPQGPPCEDHPEEPARNCRCCWADVKTGHRPPTHIGKKYQPESETTA
ncbi:hypothetical protein [Arthrobacter luteolus]|uniref:hypothetical protein n=1 Tax=Arthrobacter luteolus TaxID=98672 RepID=UPI000836AB80|nr:hypothetical protein [Arthrobacter luteolus]